MNNLKVYHDLIPVNIKEYIDLYENEDYSDKQLAEQYDVAERTIRNWNTKLRESNVIGYRNPKLAGAHSKINYVENKAKITRPELLKLANLHGNKTAVAKELDVSYKMIDRLFDEYNIVDNKTRSIKLKTALDVLLSDTPNIKPNTIKRTATGATLNIAIGDWHISKIIKDEKGNVLYDVAIARNRIDDFISQILKLLSGHLETHLNIEEVNIYCVGDMANGENIYPAQAYQQSEAPPQQVIIAVEEILKLIYAMIDRGYHVNFYGVPGNHGKVNEDPASNWDIMIYAILEYERKNHKIKDLSVSYTESEYMNINVRGWNYLPRHRAYKQDETSAGRAKYVGWQRLHDADMIISGHVHHWIMNERKVVNGSLCGHDDLAERMAVVTGEPSQTIWVTTDKYKLTNPYPVRLGT